MKYILFYSDKPIFYIIDHLAKQRSEGVWGGEMVSWEAGGCLWRSEGVWGGPRGCLGMPEGVCACGSQMVSTEATEARWCLLKPEGVWGGQSQGYPGIPEGPKADL